MNKKRMRKVSPKSSSGSRKVALPKPASTTRSTFSLPSDLAVGLDELAKRLGITKSALVTALLSQAVPNMRDLLSLLPDDPDPESVRRFRGHSIDYVMEAVGAALKEI